MRAQVQPAEGNKVKLSVEVAEEEFEKTLESTFRKLSREVRLPGFRPGKAPRKVLEARMGAGAVRREAIQEAVPDLYAEAIREHDVDAIAPPQIDITSGSESGPVSFDALVEVRPHVSVAGYQGLQVTVPSLSVSEEEVDSQVDRLRGQFAELVSVARPATDGDHVTIDIKGTRHGQTVEGLTADDYLYEVGSGSIVPALDDELRGARAGDIFKFNAEVGDQEATFQVLVKEIKQKVLPEVTDEWASDASEFDTVAELLGDLRNRIAAVKRMQAQLALRESALASLTALVQDAPPEVLVEEEVRRRLHELMHRLDSRGTELAQYLEASGLDQESMLQELSESARRAVQADLALRAVADAEGIDVTEEEVDNEIDRLAEALEKKPAEVRRQLERADRLGEVRSDIRSTKALTWLLDNVELVDADGEAVNRAELNPPADGGGAPEAAGSEAHPEVAAVETVETVESKT